MTKGFRDESGTFRAKEQTAHSGQPGKPPRSGRKRPVNVSIDEDLLNAAKALGINLSQTLEEQLRKKTKAAREANWREDHRDEIGARNRFIEKHGIWSDKTRPW